MADNPPATPEEALACFSSMISSYEHRVGHTCRAIAAQLTAYLSLPPDSRALDNACGTGAVTEELLKVFPHVRVSAADATPSMIEALHAIVANSSLLKSQVDDVRVENGQALTYPNNHFDACITNFGLFFFPDPVAGAKEIHRTLKPGGTSLVTVWKSFGFKPILWEVQDQVKPLNPLIDLSLLDPWCDPSKLEEVLKEGGFHRIKFDILKAGMWGQDKEDFKKVLLENFSAMVSRNWNDAAKARLEPVTSKVVDEMHDKFCMTDGDRLGCMMEAWVAICTK